MKDPRVLFLILIASLISVSLLTTEIPLTLFLIAIAVPLVMSPQKKQILPFLYFLLPNLILLPLIVWILQGHQAALITLLRLSCLGIYPAVFFLYCSIADFERVLLWLRLPRIFVFTISAAMSFIPLIAKQIQEIFDAQRNRGVPLDRMGGLLRYLPTLVIPVMIACFQLAEQLTETLVIRGLAHRQRPDHQLPRFTAKQWLATLLIFGGCGGLFVRQILQI